MPVSVRFSKNNLFPLRGDTLAFYVNGEERKVKGRVGEVALVRKNGKEVSLNDEAVENDEIEIRPSTKGESGRITLGQIEECKKELAVTLFGRKILCPPIIVVNGQVEDSLYSIAEGDRVEISDYSSVANLLAFADIDADTEILLNGRQAGKAAKIRDGDVITEKPKPPEPKEEISPEEELQKQIEEDPLLQPVKPLRIG